MKNKISPKHVFEKGLQYHHYANTAYPLTPGSFKEFRIKDKSKHQDFLKAEWAKTDEMSLYIHIPFCKTRCNFCEYTVLENSDIITEDLYLSLLLKEIEMYKPILKSKKVVGLDVGGGTPSKISTESLQTITNAINSSFDIQKNVIFSIETTPIIAAREPEKIEAIFKMGYKRISMGIQTISEKLLNELGREGATHIYEKATKNIRKTGFKMFNIDLMYGFLHQTDEDFENTIRYAVGLNPDYITLYRNRYKGTKLESEAGGVSLYKIINQYRIAYDLLLKNGYDANVGKNTFSKIKNDYGTSDYLTKRVIYGVPYVGMGLGAQSFGVDYLAYNAGAASKKLTQYKKDIENNNFPIQDIYALNKQETIAKMVSVAFYFGFIDLKAFENRFKTSFLEYFKDEVDFVLQNNLMEIKNGRIYLTNRGADYINGVIPLFFSENSKKELSELFSKRKSYSDDEIEFLKAYNINEYKQPSLATDIVVFATDENKTTLTEQLSVVLIKRGEHPYMNDWALPGGFVKPNETVEQTAYRELKEETGISNILLSQLQVFSEPKRDPRGWIISSSFSTIANKKDISLQFGSDAIDTQLFNVKLSKSDINNINCEKYLLDLSNNDFLLKAEIEKKTTYLKNRKKDDYSIIKSEGIAFDHAKIILVAIFAEKDII